MLQSKCFIKTTREKPKNVDNISTELLIRAGFIDKLSSGIYTLLPLGFKVFKKIENIIREEMNEISGEEISMPVLQPKSIWDESGRWKTIDPPLFQTEDRHKKLFALGPTHEEVITKIVRERIKSYKDLPFMLYQIQTKFRNELRATGGLLRTREFVMKDAYSFHEDKADLEGYYEKIAAAYGNIFARMQLEVINVTASSGTIGGKVSHEYMVLAETGEDKVMICKNCDIASNAEVMKDDKCPKCKKTMEEKSAIEVAHIFQLGMTYSEKMNASFINQNGEKNPIEMGCYGIGLGRLLATIVEVFHDKKGIVWPENVSPFDVHLIDISTKKTSKKMAFELYRELDKQKIEVLMDDRDESVGVKLSTADLLGIYKRIIVSDKTAEAFKFELKYRDKKEAKLLSKEELLKILRK